MKNKKFHTIRGGPFANSIERLVLKGTATNWVAGKLRIVCVCSNIIYFVFSIAFKPPHHEPVTRKSLPNR